MRKLFGNDGNRTFKLLKLDNKDGSLKNRLKVSSLASLGSTNLMEAVKIPKGETKNEWLAVHVVDFINGINILYGSISEYCTPIECKVMNAGEEYSYLWQNKEDPKYKKPVAVSAPDYVSLLMDWIENQVNDDKIFPSDPKVPFPKDFEKIVKGIFKRLFRVYAHVYYSHLGQIRALGEEAHLNTSFKHFLYFVYEFDLIEERELAVLKDVIIQLLGESYRGKFKKF